MTKAITGDNLASAQANAFFKDINFISIVDTIKNIYMSDGAMNTLLDFERVLDEADVYAFRNWINGELVQGPDVGRYSCKCTFMWPYKLMPDPRASLRLSTIGCNIKMMKSKIEVPVAVESYEDFQSGSRYPKMQENQIWFMQIEIPFELMDDIKEGSVDIAGDEIDLSEIEDAYDNDLEQTKTENDAGADDMTGADDITGGQATDAGAFQI
jgi:hypothetical protein|tara:strand:- start:2701 stop:3336 length:636 start_codon:yes stop_codon:yes gene_type:complete